MARGDTHIDFDLIAKYLAGECNADEVAVVEQLIAENEEVGKIVRQGDELFNAEIIDPEDKSPVTFHVESAWMKVKSQLDLPSSETTPIEPKQRFIQFMWKVAAILVVGVGITLFFYLNRTQQLEYSVAQNEINTFYLPDSSRVVLKDNSSLVASVSYNKDDRQVSLSGLGYFDVQKMPERPFIIQMDGGAVTVLGTAFLIDSKIKNEITVTVERGSVELASSEDPQKSVVLEKNESATLRLDELKITKEEVLSLNALYWANKRLVYRQEPLHQVFTELEDLFDISISYDSASISNCRLSAMFRDEPIETILQHISVSMDFEYTSEDGKYIITSDGCKQD